MDFFPLVQRFESALWISLVCHGQEEGYFQDSLGWDFGVTNYRYDNHRHQIFVPDSQRLGALIADIPAESRYADYRMSCERTCGALEETAARVAASFDPTASLRDTYRLFEKMLSASKRVMPFLPSLVLMQSELENDLREALAEDLSLDPASEDFGEFWTDALVAREQASFVPETREILKMGDAYRAEGLDGVTSVDDLPSPWRAAIDEHVDSFGWLGTFTYLNEPYTAEEVLRRIQAVAKNNDNEHQAALERDHDALERAEHAMNRLKTERARMLLDVARSYMSLRFKRVDVHFESEVLTRPIQERLAEFANVRRSSLVMATEDELRAWAVEGEPLPSDDELALRERNGIRYSVVDGAHTWCVSEPMVRTVDPSVRRQARTGLAGATACVGGAVGPVKHVTTVADMHGFQEGTILLTPMTTPDVMYAIERAGGIVTDEGGILCHAAIISRELNKPCVIGCEIATQAFRDGDVVEVSAGSTGGMVRLLRGPEDAGECAS